MRGGIGLIGLILALVITGLLVKRQLGSSVALPPLVRPALPGAAGAPPVAVPLNQLPQQTKEAVDALMQKPRPMPDAP
jgi:hypothetical protein